MGKWTMEGYLAHVTQKLERGWSETGKVIQVGVQCAEEFEALEDHAECVRRLSACGANPVFFCASPLHVGKRAFDSPPEKRHGNMCYPCTKKREAARSARKSNPVATTSDAVRVFETAEEWWNHATRVLTVQLSMPLSAKRVVLNINTQAPRYAKPCFSFFQDEVEFRKAIQWDDERTKEGDGKRKATCEMRKGDVEKKRLKREAARHPDATPELKAWLENERERVRRNVRNLKERRRSEASSSEMIEADA